MNTMRLWSPRYELIVQKYRNSKTAAENSKNMTRLRRASRNKVILQVHSATVYFVCTRAYGTNISRITYKRNNM